jgi:hypothetical protein
MHVDKQSKGEEVDYERKDNVDDHHVQEPNEEIQLQEWKAFPNFNAIRSLSVFTINMLFR